jgi:hypothetical protein
MYQDFETDVMDDLAYDAEGPARSYRSRRDTLDAYDDMDAYDEFDVDEADDGMDAMDAMEEALADALEEEDSDEFLGRIRRAASQVAARARQAAARVRSGIRQVAGPIAAIAGSIPLPHAQIVARAARLAQRLAADSADEFEALDALVDLAEDEDVLDAAAPVAASLAIHRTIPRQAARLSPQARRELLQRTSGVARRLIAQQGAQAVHALPSIVGAAQRVVRQQGLPARSVSQVVERLGRRVSGNPQLLGRMLANPAPRRSLCAACARRRARGTPRRTTLA